MISIAVAPIARDLRGKVTELLAPRNLSVRVGGRTFVAVLTPEEVAGIISAGGFAPPIQFLQTGLIRAWYARRV